MGIVWAWNPMEPMEPNGTGSGSSREPRPAPCHPPIAATGSVTTLPAKFFSTVIETLAQILSAHPKFTAGIVLWDDVVVEAAPIVGFMKRQHYTRERVRNKCKQQGWRVTVVHQIERPDPRPRARRGSSSRSSP